MTETEEGPKPDFMFWVILAGGMTLVTLLILVILFTEAT